MRTVLRVSVIKENNTEERRTLRMTYIQELPMMRTHPYHRPVLKPWRIFSSLYFRKEVEAEGCAVPCREIEMHHQLRLIASWMIPVYTHAIVVFLLWSPVVWTLIPHISYQACFYHHRPPMTTAKCIEAMHIEELRWECIITTRSSVISFREDNFKWINRRRI